MASPQADPVQYVIAGVNAWLEEAEALRLDNFTPDGAGAGPAEYFEAMHTARGRQDRLEELLRHAIMLRQGIASQAAELEAIAQEVWDAAANAEAKRGARSGNDYEGAQERYARFDLAALEPRRQARRAKRAAEIAASAAERLRLMHRGMEAIRSDMAVSLRYFALESNLEH